MNRKYIFFILIVILLIALLVRKDLVIKQSLIITSYKDATYTIDSKPVTLVNGTSEVSVTPGSASKVTTRIFGNEVHYDFNNDGREDIAFLLTQETGGSGVFYYVVAALNKETGYVGSDAVYLGDRIAPQTTEVKDYGIIVVNYADRAPGESFAVQPSNGKSIWLKLDTKTMQFGEVAQNFEGEANPAQMSLGMQKWSWISTTNGSGTRVTPKKSGVFGITFTTDGRFSATTDCNGVGGEYRIAGTKIAFSKMISTLMYCEGSQESDFTKTLSMAETYSFTSKGELIFKLSSNQGIMTFR